MVMFVSEILLLESYTVESCRFPLSGIPWVTSPCVSSAEQESPARVSPVGSASGSTRSLGVELDPVSRATQQYLEVLKRNYMI